MKANYHTHNYRCIHADGTVEDYVKAAIEAGLDEVGISDHMPHPDWDLDPNNRMNYNDLENYFKEIDRAIDKYGNKISIKKAIECEYFEEFEWLYSELKEKHKVDYLILGVHFFPYKGEYIYICDFEVTQDMLEKYTDYVIKSMESGYFTYLAHPDLWGRKYLNWDEHTEKASRRILEKAEELKMPIEINVNGLRKPQLNYNKGVRYQYPHKDFWELVKEYDVQVIIGIDAHYPEEMKDLDMGINFAKELGIKIIDRLNF